MRGYSLLRLSVSVLLVWSLLSVAGVFLGRYAIAPLMPVVSMVSYALASSYTPMLVSSEKDIVMTAYVNEPIYIHDNLTLNPGAKMTAQADLMHVLVPQILLFTVLCVWPVGSWRERLTLLAMGLPASLAIAGLTVPFLLAGKIDVMLIEDARRAGEDYGTHFLAGWMVVSESGGRWLLPLIMASLCGFKVSSVLGFKSALMSR